jgi:hypothetical protein
MLVVVAKVKHRDAGADFETQPGCIDAPDQRGGRAATLADGWHSVDAVPHLDWLLRQTQVATG